MVKDRTYIHSLIWVFAYACLWGLIYFILSIRGGIPYSSFWVSGLYASIILGIIFGINRASQSFILRTSSFVYLILWTVLYIVGFVYAILLVAGLHFFLLMPGDQLLQEIIGRFILVVTAILRALSSGQRPDYLTPDWLMEKLAPIIALLALIILFALFVALLLSYIEVLRKNREIQEAQLRVLQSQMEPHFLFNALNTIAAEISVHPQKAEMLTISLADFFRTIFATVGEETVPLEKEFQLAQRYLEIQKARFGELLQYEFTIDSTCLTQAVPALLVQPLVENALKHGWCQRNQPFSVKIQCRYRDKMLEIVVADTGCGFKKDVNQVFRMNHSLKNIQQRLMLRYGKRAAVRISTAVGEGSTITIQLPVQEEKAQ